MYCFDWSISLMSQAKFKESKATEKKVTIVSKDGKMNDVLRCYLTYQISIKSSAEIWMNRFCNSFCKLRAAFVMRVRRCRVLFRANTIKTMSSSGWKIKYYLIIEANTRVHFSLGLLFCKHLWKSTEQYFSLVFLLKHQTSWNANIFL